MSDLDTVGRYLAGSRLGVDAGRVPPAAVAAYQETLANLVWTLKWPDRLTRPELLVTFTANAKVETVSLADKDVIVFDTRLGSVFRKLTAFAMGDPNPQAVVGWGLLELAVALASVGAAWPALSAWHLGTIRNEEADADEVDPRVARSVEIQEHFVLAHEVVHAALRTGAIDQAFRESVEDLVRQCIAAAESVRDQAPVDKVIEAVVKEHIDAINSGSRYFRAGPEAREDLLRMAADTYPFREYVADWVQPRPHLIEE
ncbi:MAG: hypothetical protein ABIP57_07485, partial [Jatrophihabitantaceae bacterium]